MFGDTCSSNVFVGSVLHAAAAISSGTPSSSGPEGGGGTSTGGKSRTGAATKGSLEHFRAMQRRWRDSPVRRCPIQPLMTPPRKAPPKRRRSWKGDSTSLNLPAAISSEGSSSNNNKRRRRQQKFQIFAADRVPRDAASSCHLSLQQQQQQQQMLQQLPSPPRLHRLVSPPSDQEKSRENDSDYGDQGEGNHLDRDKNSGAGVHVEPFIASADGWGGAGASGKHCDLRQLQDDIGENGDHDDNSNSSTSSSGSSSVSIVVLIVSSSEDGDDEEGFETTIDPTHTTTVSSSSSSSATAIATVITTTIDETKSIAATTIQSRFRRYSCRKAFLKEMPPNYQSRAVTTRAAARKIQSACRMALARSNFIKSREAIRIIQAAVLCKLQQIRSKNVSSAAATAIQSCYRNYAAHSSMMQLRLKDWKRPSDNYMAIRDQHQRRKKHLTTATQGADDTQREDIVVRIQSWYRRQNARRQLKEIRENGQLDHAENTGDCESDVVAGSSRQRSRHDSDEVYSYNNNTKRVRELMDQVRARKLRLQHVPDPDVARSERMKELGSRAKSEARGKLGLCPKLLRTKQLELHATGKLLWVKVPHSPQAESPQISTKRRISDHRRLLDALSSTIQPPSEDLPKCRPKQSNCTTETATAQAKFEFCPKTTPTSSNSKDFGRALNDKSASPMHENQLSPRVVCRLQAKLNRLSPKRQIRYPQLSFPDASNSSKDDTKDWVPAPRQAAASAMELLGMEVKASHLPRQSSQLEIPSTTCAGRELRVQTESTQPRDRERIHRPKRKRRKLVQGQEEGVVVMKKDPFLGPRGKDIATTRTAKMTTEAACGEQEEWIQIRHSRNRNSSLSSTSTADDSGSYVSIGSSEVANSGVSWAPTSKVEKLLGMRVPRRVALSKQFVCHELSLLMCWQRFLMITTQNHPQRGKDKRRKRKRVAVGAKKVCPDLSPIKEKKQESAPYSADNIFFPTEGHLPQLTILHDGSENNNEDDLQIPSPLITSFPDGSIPKEIFVDIVKTDASVGDDGNVPPASTMQPTVNATGDEVENTERSGEEVLLRLAKPPPTATARKCSAIGGTNCSTRARRMWQISTCLPSWCRFGEIIDFMFTGNEE